MVTACRLTKGNSDKGKCESAQDTFSKFSRREAVEPSSRTSRALDCKTNNKPLKKPAVIKYINRLYFARVYSSDFLCENLFETP